MITYQRICRRQRTLIKYSQNKLIIIIGYLVYVYVGYYIGLTLGLEPRASKCPGQRANHTKQALQFYLLTQLYFRGGYLPFLFIYRCYLALITSNIYTVYLYTNYRGFHQSFPFNCVIHIAYSTFLIFSRNVRVFPNVIALKFDT